MLPGVAHELGSGLELDVADRAAICAIGGGSTTSRGLDGGGEEMVGGGRGGNGHRQVDCVGIITPSWKLESY